MGEVPDARDIYEEVAVCDPANLPDLSGNRPPKTASPPPTPPTGLEGFWANVERYYLQTLYHLSKRDYLVEIRTWRPAHEAKSKTCCGYQALIFEYAGNCLEMAKEVRTEAQRDAFNAHALKLLAEGAAVDNPYQQAFIKLQRRQAQASHPPGDEEPATDEIDVRTASRSAAIGFTARTGRHADL